MITSKYLRTLGYSSIKAASIMLCLKKQGCEVKNIRIHSEYIRNGRNYNVMYFGNAVSRLEAIEALSAYLGNLPKEANRNTWTQLLKELQHEEDNTAPMC